MNFFVKKLSHVAIVGIFVFFNAVVNAGVITDLAEDHKCLETVKMLDDFIGDGYGARLVYAVEDRAKQPLTFYAEQNFNDGDVQYNIVVTPTVDGMCSFEYTRTWFDDMPCMASMAKGSLKGLTYVDSVNKNISYLKNDAGLDYFATNMPNSSCMIVKKEVGFGQNEQAK